MIKYEINSIAEKPKGTEVILNPIAATLGTKSQYRVALNNMLRGIARSMRASVLPALKHHRRFTADAEDWFISLEIEAEDLASQASSIAQAVLALEAARHSKRFIASAKSALGIDLNAVIRDEDLIEYLLDSASANANLIKSLKNDTIKDIRRIVLAAKREGFSSRTVAREITERFNEELADTFDKAVKRARLIAEDQTNKLNGDLSRIRQEQAGIGSYIWQDADDRRVRPRHAEIDGNEYRWDEPTDAEGGLHPGGPVRCRCTARGVVRF